MKRKNLSRAILMALVFVAGVEEKSIFRTEAAAQTSDARARNVPMFEVDPSWPKVPAKWNLGDVSSIAIDAPGGGCMGPSTNQRSVRGRRLRQSSCDYFRRGYRRVQAHLRQPAGG